MSHRIESLEARRLLTAVTVEGSNGNDEIRVSVEGNTIIVEIDDFPQSYPDFLYDGIVINAGDGHDVIYVDSNGDNPVVVNGEDGGDEVHLGEASGDVDATSAVEFLDANPDEGDGLVLHDDAVDSNDTYRVDTDGSLYRLSGFYDVDIDDYAFVELRSGDGVDTFNVAYSGETALTIDGQGGFDKLNLNTAGVGVVHVYFASDQDFNDVQSGPGGILHLTGTAGLLLDSNQSNFEGDVSLDRGYIIERNSQVAGGLGYWRQRLTLAQTNTSPLLNSPYASGSAINDGIGYAYAQDLPFAQLGGNDLEEGDLVLRYTLKGDTNLDRTVNFADLLRLAQNYGGASGKQWAAGDTNLDQAVNFSDLLTLAQNYGGSVAFATGAAGAEETTSVARRRSASHDLLTA